MWVFIGYNVLSAVMVIVSMIMFNWCVFVLDVAVYALALMLIFTLKIDLISVKCGLINIPHFMIPCVLWYKAESYYLVNNRLVIYTGVLVSITVLIFFVTRFWEETKLSRGLISLVLFVLIFLTTTSSITLANALFDTSEKEVYSCRITDIAFMWGDNASVSIETYKGDGETCDLMVDETYAQGLTVGDTIDVMVGRGFLGLEYFTVD